MVEGQMKVLRKRYRNPADNWPKRKKVKVSSRQSVETLLKTNNLEKATVYALRDYLRKKKEMGVLLDGRPIKISGGNKKDIMNRIRRMLEQNEEKKNEVKAKDKTESSKEKNDETKEDV